MKNIIVIVFLILTINNTKAQQIVDISNFNQDWPSDTSGIVKYYKDINNNFTPFLGNWMYQNGNQTFIVHLWKESMKPIGNPVEYYIDNIFGHYELIENYGDINQTVIYTSDKFFRGTQQPIPWALDAESLDGIMCRGFIIEFSVPNNSPHYAIDGHFGLKIISSNPTRAEWKIQPRMKAPVEYHTFNLPSNIIMTKIN